MATVKLGSNATVAKIFDATPQVVQRCLQLLSYKVDGMGSGWSGRSSFFEVTNCTFPAGFAWLIQAELTKDGHTVLWTKKPVAEPLGPYDPIVDEFGNDNPDYDFQIKALRQVEKHGAGIIRVATGGGKSKIAKLIMSRFRRMTLFLTTRGILLYQMDDQLKEIGLNTGQIGDGELRLVRGVNLGMVQTLVQSLEEPDLGAEVRAVIKSMNLKADKLPTDAKKQILELAETKFKAKVAKREQTIKILEMIEVVIGEEAHEAGGNSYYQILKHCKNATVRVALTATPFMRDSAEDNMRLMAAFGPVLIDVSEELLINRGILAKPYFQYKDILPPKRLHRTSPYERATTLGYVENENMHEELVNDAKRAAALGLPVLCLILRVKHGEGLLERYQAAGLRTEFLKGENKQKERKAQLERLRKGELDVLIGTTILDVGVDCPAIGLAQLAGGGKAEVALRQRIGRVLRKKKKGPNVAFVIDYSCNHATVLRDHARQRQNIVQSTPGFVEGIVEELPWNLFEEALAA